MKKLNLAKLMGVTVASALVASSAYAEDVTLNVWTFSADPSYAAVMSEEFSALHDNIDVEVRIVTSHELVNEALRSYATGQQPDVILLDNPDFALFSSRGVFLDVTDQVNESSAISPESYFEGSMASVKWDDRIFGVPYNTGSIALFYNKDMLSAAGITQPPTTWAELAATAKTLTDPDNGVYGITFSAKSTEEGTFQFLPWAQMAGGDYGSINVPGAVEALEIWVDLLESKSASQDVLTNGQWDSTGTFNAGNAAMAISGPWELNRMAADAEFEFGVALLPRQTADGEKASALGGWNWGIFDSTEHPDEAFALLEYFATQDHRQFGEFASYPARADFDAPKSPAGNAAIDAALEVFHEQQAFAKARGPHPEWQKISKAIYDAIQFAMTGQMSAQEALDGANTTIDGIIN